MGTLLIQTYQRLTKVLLLNADQKKKLISEK